MGQIKMDALRNLAENAARDVLKDAKGFSVEAATLAQKCLTLQIFASTQKMLGSDTTLIEKAIESAYYNLAFGGSALAARKTNKMYADFVSGAVGVLFDAAGLKAPASKKTTSGDKE